MNIQYSDSWCNDDPLAEKQHYIHQRVGLNMKPLNWNNVQLRILSNL